MHSLRSFYHGKRVFVTGHTGFKGSWLTLWLSTMGADVAGYSDQSFQSPSNYHCHINNIPLKEYFGDICDFATLSSAIDDFQPEIVIHLAAQALVYPSYRDPLPTFRTNALGTTTLLEIARLRSFIKSLLIITSDKAYLNQEWSWGYRETDVLAGRDPYSASKSCADIITQSYHHSYFSNPNTPNLGIARAGNVIGGGDWAPNRIIPDLIRAWVANNSLFIRSPSATRPWQHVLEPLSAYLLLAKSLYLSDRLNGEAFNFGPDPSSNPTVQQLLTELYNCCSDQSNFPKIDYSSTTQNTESSLLKLSIDKSSHLLGWRPVLAFKETAQYTMQWYEAWMHDPSSIHDFSLSQIDMFLSSASYRNYSWA